MSEQIVRVTRTYHVTVDADYGDTPDDLVASALKSLDADAKPTSEDAVLMPEGAKL